MKLKQELPEPFPHNPNPRNLKVGDRVVTDFYPGQEATIRTIKEILEVPNRPSGLALRLSGPGQWMVYNMAVVIDAGRCLPVNSDHTLKIEQ
jgi:hypothetical protein